MDAIRWLFILVFITTFEEKQASSRNESTKLHQDLFACESVHFRPNGSTTANGEVALSTSNQKWFPKLAMQLCSLSSSSRTFLEIKLKHFYDICAVSVWTNSSNLAATNFRIQYHIQSNLWLYYKEMGLVKHISLERDQAIKLQENTAYFSASRPIPEVVPEKENRTKEDIQGVKNGSKITLHSIQLTTMNIRFIAVKWEKGTCLQFALHGNVALCNDSQRRMDQWCNRTLSHRTPPARECYGELRARHDRNRNSPLKLWRCFYESALTSDLSSYDDKSNSPCYFTKHLELRRVLQSCSSNVSKGIKEYPLNGEDRNETKAAVNVSEALRNSSNSKMLANTVEPLSNHTYVNLNNSETHNNSSLTAENTTAALLNNTSVSLNISGVLTNLRSLKERTSQPLSSRGIVEVVNLINNLSPEKLLGNTTQRNKDTFAKYFLEISSALFNEDNIPPWKSSLSHSSTLSRLLKAVEDFGEVFTTYLECDNKTEREKTFSLDNIKFIAKSCLDITAFPLKLSSSHGCNLTDCYPDNCSECSDDMDSVTIPRSSLDDQQQYQVAFISYKNAHRLFPDESSIGNTFLRSAKVNSRILSLTVKPDESIAKGNPVTLTLRPFSHNSLNEEHFHCGFWNFSASRTANGAWSSDGCTLQSISASQVTCQCDHLTNFALLLQTDPESTIQGVHQEILMWMTYFGLSLSFVAEILCFLAFMLLTKKKEAKIKIHSHLVACLAVGHFVFLLGIERATFSKPLCRFVAASLHYLFLAAFMWMLVEGLHLLSRVNSSVQQKYDLPHIAYFLTYGLPLIIGGATFALKFHDYGTSKHCWLSFESDAKWSFIVPVCCIVLVNFFVLGSVLKRLTSTQMFRRRNEWRKLRLTVRASMTILPLLGLSWIFGLVAVNQNTVVFQYLFVGFNSLQGGFIFLFHCVINTEVRAGVRRIIRRRRVTQQVSRVASKPGPSQGNSPHDRKNKQSSFNTPGFSIPFIVIDQHFEVAQSVRLTKVIRKTSVQSIKQKRKGHRKDASAKHAWKDEPC